MIRAAWPDREPTWPAFLEGGAVLRITNADANNWLPRALRSAVPFSATAGATRRRHSPSPHTSGGAGYSLDGRREKVGWGAGPPDPRPPHGTA